MHDVNTAKSSRIIILHSLIILLLPTLVIIATCLDMISSIAPTLHDGCRVDVGFGICGVWFFLSSLEATYQLPRTLAPEQNLCACIALNARSTAPSRGPSDTCLISDPHN